MAFTGPRGARLLAAVAIVLATILMPTTAMGADDTTQFAVTPGALDFGSAPDTPNLPGLTLNAQAQTLSTQMSNFGIADATGTGAGWNITVSGNNASGKSPVLKEYCPNASCGPNSGPGYIAGGPTLPANSITLNSSGASFSPQGGSTGTGPTHQCNSGCFVDAPPAGPTKIVSAATGAGMGTFVTTGFSSSSVSLAAPSTLRRLEANEVYRVDLVWSLNSGP